MDKRNSAVPLWGIGLVCVLVLASVGTLGWNMLVRQQKATSSSDNINTPAKVILTQDDLEAAEKSLDELDFSDSDAASAELQAEL